MKRHKYVCLITTIWMICSMIHFDLTWPITLGQTLTLTIEVRISFDLYWRQQYNGGDNMVALGPIGQKWGKKFGVKHWCLTSVKFDLWNLKIWPEVKSGTSFQRVCFIANRLFLPIVTIYLSLSRASLGYFPSHNLTGGGGAILSQLLSPKLLVRFSKLKRLSIVPENV